jgi:hypothetical protein
VNCPFCRGARLVLIDIAIAGDHVRLHSCSRCDRRWWERNGERIALGEVLDLAASTRR